MVRSRRCAWVLLLAAGAAAADNRVQDPGSPWPTTVEPPRAAAMGGAHAAIATGNDAMSVNPAGLGQVRRYHLEVDGLYDAKFPAQAGLASLVDSASGPGASGALWSRWARGPAPRAGGGGGPGPGSAGAG